VGKKPKARPVTITRVAFDPEAEQALAALPEKFRGQIAQIDDTIGWA